MEKRIAVLPGDGIGPEVIAEAEKVLHVVARRFNHEFTCEHALVGAAAIDVTGEAFPEKTKSLCKRSDAILFGAVGHPKYDRDPFATVRPEQGLLQMRKELGLYANVRPVRSYEKLLDRIPLKAEIARSVDLVVFRELTGGIYFGDKGRMQRGARAYDQCVYTKKEITRIARLAFEAARKRSGRLTVVDKANVLETSRLWRETVSEIARTFADVKLDFMYVDNAAMQLMLDPRQFDVILTENMFGDILTDEASVLAGSLGLLPSLSVGDTYALYEPIHGSYPQAAGKQVANPIGAILSVAMMLDHSFDLPVESAYIYKAVQEAIEEECVTPDLKPKRSRTTAEVGDRIASFVYEEVLEIV